MQGDARVIEFLNAQLTSELTAINQYFLHARMWKNWGFEKIAKHDVFLMNRPFGDTLADSWDENRIDARTAISGFAAGLLEADDVVIISASGTSGAGKSLKPHLLGSEAMGSMSTYGVGG